MKLLMATFTKPYPPMEGEAIVVYNWIKFLHRDNEIFLVSPRIDKKYYDFSSMLEGHYEIDPKKEVGAIDFIISFLKKEPLSFSRYKRTLLKKKIKDICISESINNILMVGPNLLLILDDKQIRDMSLVWFAADSLPLNLERYYETETSLFRKVYLRLQKSMWINVYRKYNHLFKNVIFVDKNSVNSYTSLIPGKNKNIHVLPNGVDLEYFNNTDGNNIKENAVVFHGVMSAEQSEKAAYEFVKILDIVNQSKSEVVGYIVGRGPSNALANINTTCNYITVTGKVDDVRVYLNKAKIYLAPFVSGTGIKNRVLEAMALGLPVIGTKLAFEALIQDQNAFVSCKDNEEMAQKILYYLDNEDELQQLGINARKYVSTNYTWNSNVKKLEKLIN